MNDETTEITYETGVRTFDHTAVASLGAYHRVREALNDIARDSEGITLADLLEAVRDMALTTPYADSCECVSGFAERPPAWPHKVDRVDDWLTCHYRCAWCHRVWTCGYSASFMAWFSWLVRSGMRSGSGSTTQPEGSGSRRTRPYTPLIGTWLGTTTENDRRRRNDRARASQGRSGRDVRTARRPHRGHPRRGVRGDVAGRRGRVVGAGRPAEWLRGAPRGDVPAGDGGTGGDVPGAVARPLQRLERGVGVSGVSSTGPAGDADDGRAPSLDAPLLPDRSAVDGPKPSGEGTTPETGVQAVRDETVALLARTMDPAAYDRRAVAANLGQSWDRFTRRQAVEAHAEAAVAAGWVRVVEDGDTIERLAELLTNWFEGKGRAAFWDSQDMARAAVRALREET